MTDRFQASVLPAALVLTLLGLGASRSAGEFEAADAGSRYLALPKPGKTPERFAPGLVSTDAEHEFGSVFSADGLEFYYGVDVGGRTETRCMRFEDGAWGDAQVVLADAEYSFNDPFLSPDGERLYFISDLPLGGEGAKKDHDIWYVQREADGWSAPVNAGPAINSERDEYFMSFTRDGDMYFGSNAAAPEGRRRDFDLFVSRSVDGEFQAAERLPGEVNTPDYEADVFVAPDESYVVFSSERPGGLGRGDLYVSYRREDGTWRPAARLAAPINGPGHELCPFVTADGERFFYTSNGDIFCVDAAVLAAHR